MDSSSLMGLEMLVPIIGLPQGHANGKTIKTIPNVPLNTNSVLSYYQELKYSGFSSAGSLPWTKYSMIGVIGHRPSTSGHDKPNVEPNPLIYIEAAWGSKKIYSKGGMYRRTNYSKR